MSRFKSLNVLVGVIVVFAFSLGTIATASANSHSSAHTFAFKGQHLTIWDFFPSTPLNTPERVATNKVAQTWAKANKASVTEPAQPSNGSNTAFQADPKKAADIIMVPDDQSGADYGAHLTLQTHLNASLYTKTAVSGCTIAGKTWCYPWALEEVVLYYNKHDISTSKILSLKTWTQLAAWSKTYSHDNPGKYGVAWAWENGYYDNDFLTAFGGGTLYHGSKGYVGNRVLLDSAATVKGLEAFKSFVNASGTGVNTYLTNEGYGSDFASGKDAIVLDGPWSDGSWISAGMKKGVDYGVVPLPGFKEGKKVVHGTPFVGVQTMVVNRYSKHAAAAQSLANYLSTHMELPLYNASGRIPATKNALKKVSGNAELKQYSRAFGHSEPLPNVPEMADVWSPMQNAITLTLKGSGSAAKNLRTAQTSVCKVIGGCKG